MKKSLNAGRSIIEILWEELDSIMDRLMADGEPPEGGKDWNGWIEDLDLKACQEEWQAYGEERGQAQGVAYALAVMSNPYAPNVPFIKQIAMERYQERQES